MTGYIISSSGVETELPAFLSWDVCHGIGEPCDWFEVSFIYYSHQLSMLQSACRFRAEHNNSVVFTGVVDEYSISIDEHGSVATISGRSHAALLLDNELSAAAYAAMSSESLINSFVTPYGVSQVVSGAAKSLADFNISTGESAWSAVKRFSRYAWGTTPFFTPAGALILNGRQGSSITINADKDAHAIKLRDERYGIISDVRVKNRVTGASYTVRNEDFIARGGKSHRELTVPKTTGADAARYTAEYQIAESKRGKHFIELTLTQQFACFPGDVVTLSSTVLGVNGSYRVGASHCWADSFSAGTIVTLEV
nr:MAG TPA: 43 kDa tail protein [Caudoviricetes sp.]